ncbi:hypothetical protein Q7P35_001861 [Cladosporium inversicolor]
MATTTGSSLDSSYIFSQLDNYPWDDDQEFQGGLKSITGSTEDQAQLEHLTLRAKCFYYARKSGMKVDFEGYKRWVEDGRGDGQTNGLGSQSVEEAPAVQSAESQGASTGSGAMGDAPKPASFAEICELIAEGKPIPGIKDIPDTVLEGQSTVSQAAKRTKPWEKAGGSTEKPSWMK